MPDIFISYSSHDREQAELLTELLASAGLSVWIDQSALNAASSWSKEIVEAINGCKVFVVLLSPASLDSHNVIKEVALASEKRKKILPLDLEPVALTSDFEYQLAGIQRAPMTNIDSIIRALGKLGLEATGAPQAPKITHAEKDTRKALIILPFEDLSPTQDNQWFADGLAGELIDVLGHIKSLRILDRKTSLGLRTTTVTTIEIGKLFNTRYFIEGSVRKFGDQIKISVSLLDIETGDHLWQESHKGKFEDIFDIQESVAQKVVEGLKLHLTKIEKTLLQERGTENAEAYEFYIKAREYFSRITKEGFLLSIQLYTEAIELDPMYARAYGNKAHALAEFFRMYDRDPELLQEAERLALEAMRLKPDAALNALTSIYMLQGKNREAEETAKEWIRIEPENWISHFSLGYFYQTINQQTKAILPFEESIRLNPDMKSTYFNLVIAFAQSGEETSKIKWASVAIPVYERYLKLYPEDEYACISHAYLLFYANRVAESKAAALKLDHIQDVVSLFNLASLYVFLEEFQRSLTIFRRAMEGGYRNIPLIKEFLANEDGIGILHGTPEYEEVKRMVEEIEAEKEEKKK